MDILFWSVVFLASLAVLIKSSTYFTDAAEDIGLMLGMSHFVVGVTIVGMGTSLPELVSSIIAVVESSSEIVAGNVFGSNIANIFLVFGIGAIAIKQIGIKHDLINIDLPLLLGSAFYLAITCWDGVFTRGEAAIAVFGLILFILYSLNSVPKGGGSTQSTGDDASGSGRLKPIAILVVSAVFIFLGAKYTVESVVSLSKHLNIGADIIAVSAVALGTSLPELAVTLSAVKKKNLEIVIGNVLGSNLFNTFAVMGIPGLIGDLSVPTDMRIVALPVLVFASVLFFVVTQDRQVTRWEGWFFVMFYLLFTGKIFGLA